MSRLLEYLPWYEKSSSILAEILRAEEIEFDKLNLKLKDLDKQFIVDTASWGLAIYEKELKLAIKPNKTLEERRSLIKAKMRGMGKVDHLMIKAIVEAFTNAIVDIVFDGRINIIFTNQGEIRFSKEMSRAINEIKPAHLDYDYIVNYLEELILQTREINWKVKYPMVYQESTASRRVDGNRNKVLIKSEYMKIRTEHEMLGQSKISPVRNNIRRTEFKINYREVVGGVNYHMVGQLKLGGI